MLNHSCEVETFLNYDKSSHAIAFTTDRPYQPGEQVCKSTRSYSILRRRLRDMKSGELRGLSIFNGFFRFFE
ncbi:hypothetical protein GIB67_003413 [Kingdonia uniflora]|uniref:SET domain-containing protein n=1 Tax=Kingdonia uniflora TaxID=39325 RepID=A0A7J7P8Z5_9MAGN|nr:hypothetical protein GIB67_003413 [Kingdonia uniflora]